VVFLCLCGSAQGQTCVDRLKVEGVHPSLRSRVDQLLAKGTVKDFITQAGGVDQALAKARRQLAEGEQMLASDEGRCSTNPNCSKEHIYKGQAAVLMSRALVAAVECRAKIVGKKMMIKARLADLFTRRRASTWNKGAKREFFQRHQFFLHGIAAR